MSITIIAEWGSGPAPAWDFTAWANATAAAGADAGKVQLWRISHFGPEEAQAKLPYVFPRERLSEFARACHDLGLQAGASVFDDAAVRLAARHCDFLKLAAREMDNHDLLYAASESAYETGRHLYRSISDLSHFRRIHPSSHITHLCALQRYPAPMLATLAHVTRAAAFFRRQGVVWGHSSHTTGILDAWWASCLGASVVEKHIDLTGHGIEAAHSLTPDRFARLVRAVRAVENRR